MTKKGKKENGNTEKGGWRTEHTISSKTKQFLLSPFSFFPFSFLLFSLLWACTPDYSPKPTGYFYIDIAEHKYKTLTDFPKFEFDISTQIKVIKTTDTIKEQWFNLAYPSLNAQIYCSYIPITKNIFEQVSEENRKFVDKQVLKSGSIREQVFENPEQKVYGLVYTIKGNVPSPVQFVLTDSVNSFFRGALYFNDTTNQDSIAPVLEYINEDIQVIIESFRWKK
jgi:gliding motility-associated lipoprotein GldD